MIGVDGTETRSATPNPYSNYRHRFLHPDHLGYLYFQYNETTKPSERDPLTCKVSDNYLLFSFSCWIGSLLIFKD